MLVDINHNFQYNNPIKNYVGWKMLKIMNLKIIERTFPPLIFGGYALKIYRLNFKHNAALPTLQACSR